MEVTYDTCFCQKDKAKDAEWFEDLGVNIKPFSNRVDILTSSTSAAA